MAPISWNFNESDYQEMSFAPIPAGDHRVRIANVEEMKDAKIHPEDHEDLIVRVGGFSIHFNDLDNSHKDEIISRYS